jgi:hypothetical protein
LRARETGAERDVPVGTTEGEAARAEGRRAGGRVVRAEAAEVIPGSARVALGTNAALIAEDLPALVHTGRRIT